MRTFTAVALATALSAPAISGSLEDASTLIEGYEYRAALTMLQELESVDPARQALLLARAWNGISDWEQGLEHAERAVELAPKSSAARLEHAIALRNKMSQVSRLRAMGSVGAYKDELKRAIELDPGNLDAREEQIGFLMNAPGMAGGDRDEARKKIEALKQLDWSRGMLMSADMARQVDELDRSVGLYQELLDREPENSEGHLGLGYVYQQQDRFRQAAEEFDAASSAGKRVVRLEALYQGGRSRVLGEFDPQGAVRGFDVFVGERGDDPIGVPTRADAYWRRGLALEQAGDPAGARSSYESALKIDPDHGESKKALRKLK